MNFIFSIHKNYVDLIFKKEKPFEFRNILPKQINLGDIIYIYETAKNKGCQKIVGEVSVESIIDLCPNQKYPMYGAWSLIDYYMKYIEKEPLLAQLFKENKQYQLEEYKFGCLLPYALSPYYMDLIKSGKYPDYNSYMTEDNKKVDLANHYMYKCDDWLRKIGFYNYDDKSYWKYAIQIKPITYYDFPKEITTFINQKGEQIQHPPQSWMYTLN